MQEDQSYSDNEQEDQVSSYNDHNQNQQEQQLKDEDIDGEEQDDYQDDDNGQNMDNMEGDEDLTYQQQANLQASHQDQLINEEEVNNYYQMNNQVHHEQRGVRREPFRGVTLDQQKIILRKAMTLDKQDRKKTEDQLKMEVDELKKMKNQDEADIKMLKVELSKLEMVYKKFKDMGSFQASVDNQIIQLPERFINKLQLRTEMDQNEYQNQTGIADTQQLLEDINFVKNQLQCEIIKIKNSEKSNSQFFGQRNSGGIEASTMNQLKSIQSYNDKNLLNFVSSNNSFQNLSGQSQSQIRIQINNYKTKCKLLQDQIQKKDEEIQNFKLSKKQNSGEEKVKIELGRAYNILKQLQKRIKQSGGYSLNQQNLQQEYEGVITQLQEALQIPPPLKLSNVQADSSKNNETVDMSDMIQQTVDNIQTSNNDTGINQGDIQEGTTEGNDQYLLELKQKISDLNQELQMSPRQFEDKLLHKLREEILMSKKKMQDQMQSELNQERERMIKMANSNPRKEELQQANRQLNGEVKKLKGVIKKGAQANLPLNLTRK